MGSSKIAFAAADRLPWLVRPILRAALSVFPYKSRTPHWVLMGLKDRLDIRVSRPMEVDGFTVEADPFDGPGRGFWRQGLTEPETRAVVANLLRPGMVMFDIGAYVGQFSLVASRATNGEARIIAVEPTPKVFAQLRRNMEINRCAHVACVQAAVSSVAGRQKLYFFPASNDQNSLFPLDAPTAKSVEVDVETLGTLVSKHGLTRLDFVKIDVEGNEKAVLEGARETLTRFRPVLIIEISRHQRKLGYSGADIKEILDGLNYRTFRVEKDGCPAYEPSDEEINPSSSHFNILAVPAESSIAARLTPSGGLDLQDQKRGRARTDR